MKYFFVALTVFALSSAIVFATLFGGLLFISLVVLVFSLALATLLVMTGVSLKYGAPYLPTVSRTVREMIAIADIKPGDRFIDLGSGDGRLVIAAAQAGAIAEGWEVNPYLWAYAWWKIFRAGLLGRARVRLRCFWGDRLSEYDVVSLFLITGQMPRMEEKLQKELRPGARVISTIFTFPSWKIAAQTENGVYLYRR